MMKDAIRLIIQRAIDIAPWGVRNAVLEACIKKFGMNEVLNRALTHLRITEIGATGELGVIRSSWNDRQILLTYARTGVAESAIIEEMNKFFGDNEGTYIDVGANIGLTTIPIAKKHKIRCIAFEPDPTNFKYLQLNTSQNLPENSVELKQMALFDRKSTLQLALSDGNLGDHRITFAGIEGRRMVDVPAVPLDDILPEVSGRLAIKVDTQGAEPFVIAGGRKVFGRAQLVALEFCPYLMRIMGGDHAVVIDLLSKFDDIALLPPGSDAAPIFMKPSDALQQLEHKLRDAKDTDGDYLDVLARRT